MANLRRFALVYRKDGILQVGSEIEGKDLKQAVEVARKWCTLEPGRKFVSVNDAVVAGPEILGKDVKPEAAGADNFEELSVRVAMNTVQRGDITAEEAIEREKAGQNRKSLLNWLESKAAHPEEQGVPF